MRVRCFCLAADERLAVRVVGTDPGAVTKGVSELVCRGGKQVETGRVKTKHMLMPVTGVRDSAYYSIVDEEWSGVRDNLRARLRIAAEAAGA